jgi:hypothetical protein
MSEQVIPSAVAQRIIVKFLTNVNVKPAEILMRLRLQFGNKTLSRIRCLTGVSHLKETEDRLKTGKAMAGAFGDSQGVLFIDFLI